MADVLSQIPGLAGYLAMENQRRQAAMADLKGVSGLASLLQQQREAALQEQMAPLKMQALQAQADEARRKGQSAQAFEQAIAGLPMEQRALARLAPGQFVTGAMKAQNPESGVPTPLAKAIKERAAAEARGDTQAVAFYDEYIPRVAKGFTALQLQDYFGIGFRPDVERAKLGDQGIPAPVPGQQPLPRLFPPTPQTGAVPQQQSGSQIAFPSNGRVPEENRQRVLSQERDSAIANNDPVAAELAQREMGITDYSGRQATAPQSNATQQSAPQTPALSPRQQRELETRKRAEQIVLNTKQYDEYRKQIPALNASVRSLERLQGLIDSGKTFSNAGAELKMELSSLAQAVGIEINVDRLANSETYIAQVAELLKARLGSKDYGSGTGVSNLDLLAAGRPLPEIAKSKEGQRQIIQALLQDATEQRNDINAYRKHYNENNGDMSKFIFPSEKITEDRIKKIKKAEESNPRVSRGKVRPADASTAPAGVPQRLWDVMTPQEKAEWQN